MTKKAVLLIALSILFLSHISGQSSYLDTGQNGPGFKAAFRIGEQALLRSGGTLGFSIGGKMDIGFLLEAGPENPSDPDQIFTDLGISYGYLVLKQEDRMPLNFSISGSYALSNIYSDDLLILRQERSGLGWTIGTQLSRDFILSETFYWRLGAEFQYRAFRYETINLDDPEGETTVPPTPIPIERAQSFLYGGSTETILRIPEGPFIAIGIGIYFDEDTELNFIPSLSVTQPLD
jgi:hypothetical protein